MGVSETVRENEGGVGDMGRGWPVINQMIERETRCHLCELLNGFICNVEVLG